jgi:hypothetical protein
MQKTSDNVTQTSWSKRLALAGVLVAAASVVPVVATQAGTPPNRSDADGSIGLLRGKAEGLGSFERGELASSDWKRVSRVDPANAQKADTGSSPWKVWLAGTGANVCLYFALPDSSTASVACGPADEMAAGRMAITHTGGGADPPVTVIGVAPDGVSAVAVKTKGGSKQASVQDNVFVAPTDDSASSYSYGGPDGVRTVPIYVDK